MSNLEGEIFRRFIQDYTWHVTAQCYKSLNKDLLKSSKLTQEDKAHALRIADTYAAAFNIVSKELLHRAKVY